MLKQTSKDFRVDFLKKFTEELIRATDTYKHSFIKKEVKEVIHEKEPIKITPRKELREIVQDKIKKEEEKFSRLKQAEEVFSEFQEKRLPERRIIPPLRIPKPILPGTVNHFQPFPTEKSINLEKLNPLIRDPLVKIIECNGPDERVIVNGIMGRKPTKITLRKDQIEDIIDMFSQATKIPVHEGIFRVVYGNLILNAIVSEIVGSKFIIRKMR